MSTDGRILQIQEYANTLQLPDWLAHHGRDSGSSGKPELYGGAGLLGRIMPGRVYGPFAIHLGGMSSTKRGAQVEWRAASPDGSSIWIYITMHPWSKKKVMPAKTPVSLYTASLNSELCQTNRRRGGVECVGR